MTMKETTDTQGTEATASFPGDAHPLDLETVYEKFKRPIHSYIYRLLGSEEDAAYLPLDSGGIPEIFEREHIRLTLANMPQEYAIALILSAAQGIPYQEIATIMGISPGSAATRISRAKRMFAEQYQCLN